MRVEASELRELRRDLVRASYLKGDFVLRSGKRSNRYFDKFLLETDPHLLRRLGRHLASLVPPATQRLAAIAATRDADIAIPPPGPDGVPPRRVGEQGQRA